MTAGPSARPIRARGVTWALGALALIAGCGGDDGPPPLFPADYAATYQQVRSCRFSLEHDSTRMRVLAAPDAVSIYQTRSGPFPAGGIVLKEQFDSSDMTCSGPLVEITVMQKAPDGSAPDTIGWTWQKVSPEKRDITTDTDRKRCVACHADCGKPPEGHDGTCAVP